MYAQSVADADVGFTRRSVTGEPGHSAVSHESYYDLDDDESHVYYNVTYHTIVIRNLKILHGSNGSKRPRFFRSIGVYGDTKEFTVQCDFIVYDQFIVLYAYFFFLTQFNNRNQNNFLKNIKTYYIFFLVFLYYPAT